MNATAGICTRRKARGKRIDRDRPASARTCGLGTVIPRQVRGLPPGVIGAIRERGRSPTRYSKREAPDSPHGLVEERIGSLTL